MKQSIILITTLFIGLVALNKVQAQPIDDERTKLVIGAKAGGNMSDVYDSQGQNFKANPKLGFAGGGFIGIPIGKYVGFQPEVLFSQKGYQSSGTILGGTYTDTRTTSYLDIPLQMQFKPAEFITFLGGVQYSYLLHQKDVFVFGTNSTAQDQQFKNDNVRKNIFGAVFGIDINVDHFILSGKGCWDLQNNVGNGSSYTPRYKNIWFQIAVGFRLYK
ncbi:MAG TPA: porin family protein [Bacteroidia bacterium]|jgi:hypothetical protein|nr:porin family protein [Bacteroidia bacterium]